MNGPQVTFCRHLTGRDQSFNYRKLTQPPPGTAHLLRALREQPGLPLHVDVGARLCIDSLVMDQVVPREPRQPHLAFDTLWCQ